MKEKIEKMPFYFYHVVDKNADLSKGLLSLQYMYDHGLNQLFDNSTKKYVKRITNDWNLKKYQNKEQLTREEILDALNKFRGKYGTSYLYFFRYPLKEKLGFKIKDLLKYKDIYRINLNDDRTRSLINDIFWGYDMSNSDNPKLDQKYYEKVTEEDYFKKYDDNLEMNFATLNHIAISFKNNYCPIELLEKVS